MNPVNKMIASALLAGCTFAAFPPVALAAPALTMQQERAAHPEIALAIHRLNEAIHALEAAPDDFGGNKAAAIADAHRTIYSLKKALYWRLRMDDAAINRAE